MPAAAPRILILRCGHTDEAVIARHGDYEAWFAAALEGHGCRFTVRHVPEEGPGGEAGHDGILITGTAASVREDLPWMRRLGDHLAARAGGDLPVLAVCFGAQLAARALGGRVERNPRGWEIGTIGVDLTPAGAGDPLFAGLPRTLAVQSTHEDHATDLPGELTVLAGNGQTPVQAFGWGQHLRGVQFHPEAGPGIIAQLIALRRETLETDAREHGAADAEAARLRVQGLADGLHESGHGRAILGNWLRAYVRGESPA